MKKLLAILCTVALLLTSLFTGMAVMAEEPELKPLAPSSYGGDGQSFAAEAWAGGANTQNFAFVNAKFEAMVIPSADSHLFQWGFWTGLRLSISGNTARFWMFDTGAQSEVATLDKNYNGTPYKLTVTSQLLNEGVLPAENEEYTTAHEHFVYNLYIDGKQIIKDFIVLGNDPIVPGNKVNKCLRASNCTIYDIDTYEAAFTATDADAAGPLDGLTALTPADFGIAYGRCDGDWTQGTTAKDTANSVFETNIMFEKGGEMVYPRNTGWPGIMLTTSGNTNLAITNFHFDSGLATTVIEASKFNVGSLVGNMVNLKVVLEIGDFDGNNIINDDGTETVLKDDARLTYYINGIEACDPIEYKAEYEEYDAVTGNAVLETRVAGTGDLLFKQGDRTLFSLYFNNKVIIEDPNCEVPVMLENAATNGALVLGKLNTVDVTLAEGDSIAMGYLGNLAVTEGALVYTDKAGNASTVAENMAGVKFNLKTLVQRIDFNGDGFVTEVKARVWVNDKATSAYQYINTLPVAQTISLSGTAAISAASQIPTGLSEILPSDAGIDSTATAMTGWGRKLAGKTFNKVQMSSNNTLFSAYITTDILSEKTGSNNQFNIHFGPIYNASTWSRYFRLASYIGGNSWGIGVGSGNVGSATVDVELGKEFLYQVSVQKSDIDLDADGVLNDYKIGFFIDGVLLSGQFYTIALTDDVATSAWGFNIEHAISSDVEAQYSIRSEYTTVEDFTEYKEIVIEDFGFENGTYSVSDAAVAHWYNAPKTQNFNYKAFTTKIKFDVDSNKSSRYELTYLGKNNMVSAVIVSMEADGTGAFRYGTEAKHKMPDLKANVESELTITSVMSDGGYKFGFYVDGKLQGYLYTPSVGYSPWYGYIGIRTLAGTSYAGGSLTLGAANYNVGVAAGNSYTVAASTENLTYTLNGEAVTEETTLSDVGEYVIGTTSALSCHNAGSGILDQTGTKTVVIYKENDLNADNTVNILDFIAAQKSASEEDFDLGKVGAFAAGIAVGERCTAKEIVALKIAILFAL